MCSTPRIAQKKSQTVFFYDVVRLRGVMSMFQEVKGACMGFQRGAGGFEFRTLTAWGKAVEQSGGAGSDAPEPSS